MPDRTCYLPITEDTVRDLADGDIKPGLRDLSIPQLACLAILRAIPGTVGEKGIPAVNAERRLAHAIDSMNHDPALVESAIRELATQDSVDRIQSALEDLDKMGLAFLYEEDVEKEAYLNSDRSWNHSFTEFMEKRHRSTPYSFALRNGRTIEVSDNQLRILNELDAAPDEPCNVEGYAGTGKTWTICALLDTIMETRGNAMLLALSRSQIKTVCARLRRRPTHALTFADLGIWLIINGPISKAWRLTERWRRHTNLSDEGYAAHLEVGATGDMPRGIAVRDLIDTVRRYCFSRDDVLDAQHISEPRRQRLQWSDQIALVEFARSLWWRIVDVESKHNDLPIRYYHLIKYAALQRFVIPCKVGFVIVDEAHEMPASLMQILDQSPQRILTFGDRYQRIGSIAPRRNPGVRAREINQSVRAGRETEGYVNAALRNHREEFGLPFVGSSDKTTIVDYYTGNRIPESPCTILASDYWELFEWFQRLAASKVKFALLGRAARDMRKFGHDCILLYTNGFRPKHQYLFRYETWNQLVHTESVNDSFNRIHALLEKGYRGVDLENSLNELSSRRNAVFLLGRAEDAKNAEFDQVMLTPGFGVKLQRRGGDSEIESKLYVGGTRARSRMILPRHIREWWSGGRDGSDR